MPFKSKAQQRFMFAAESQGKLKPGTARKWAHETKNMKKLPEHVKKAAFEAALFDELSKLAAKLTWKQRLGAGAIAAGSLGVGKVTHDYGRSAAMSSRTDAAQLEHGRALSASVKDNRPQETPRVQETHKAWHDAAHNEAKWNISPWNTTRYLPDRRTPGRLAKFVKDKFK